MTSTSYWLELKKTFASYVVVAVSLVPFGIAYALLMTYHPFGQFLVSPGVTLSLCLGAGLIFAYFLQERFRRAEAVETKGPLLYVNSQQHLSVRRSVLILGMAEPEASWGAATVLLIILTVGPATYQVTDSAGPISCRSTNLINCKND